MNRQQRISNRRNAADLAAKARQRRLAEHTCENCGEKGGHWIETRGMSLQGMVDGRDDSEGFWTCARALCVASHKEQQT